MNFYRKYMVLEIEIITKINTNVIFTYLFLFAFSIKKIIILSIL